MRERPEKKGRTLDDKTRTQDFGAALQQRLVRLRKVCGVTTLCGVALLQFVASRYYSFSRHVTTAFGVALLRLVASRYYSFRRRVATTFGVASL